MPKNVNSFGVFLETLQQVDVAETARTVRSSSAPAPEGNATAHILHSLQRSEKVHPAALGLNFVELGRALERLLSLQAIRMVEENGREVIQRGEKFDDVCSLLSLQ